MTPASSTVRSAYLGAADSMAKYKIAYNLIAYNLMLSCSTELLIYSKISSSNP